MKIAIIGAGISGLTAAMHLNDVADITLFEKSRGAGGRICSRYTDAYSFDHGAQFFTARTPQFKKFLEPLIESGVIANWNARFIEFRKSIIMNRRVWGEEHPHYIGTPTMSSIGQYLAKDLNINLNTEVSIKKCNQGWNILDSKDRDLGKYDWVISTIPAEQSLQLLPEYFSHTKAIEQKKMLGCYSLMLGFEQALNIDWDAALISEADISWISVNSSKSGRPKNYSLLVHSTNDWAENHLDDASEAVIKHLCSEVQMVTGQDVSMAQHIDLHRWRYANISRQAKSKPFIDNAIKIAACGDWCAKGRIEAAFRSGFDLAKEMRMLLK